MLKSVLHASVVVLLALQCSPSYSQEGPPLTVLTPNGDEHVIYLTELDALDQVQFSTATIWTDNSALFSGVPVLLLLEILEADGTTLRMSALNDYAVEMPVAELEEDAPIIATRMDGKTMSIREKGPYWIMFPFDNNPKYRTEENFARSVWQLKSLTVLD